MRADDIVAEAVALDVWVQGVVQGVGFRPFSYRTATCRGVTGWVRNEAGSVRIAVTGSRDAVASFLADVRKVGPPAHVDRVQAVPMPSADVQSYVDFRIVPSEPLAGGCMSVPPDLAVCDACLSEVSDPRNRRYGYPFITCTRCGPRFTTIASMPYDRERTAMGAFRQCTACLSEHDDPGDRRHHCETNSCPACGPRIWLEPSPARHEPVAAAGALLAQGAIVAVRGLGGFHLVVDACSEEALRRLRVRKHRDAKPFAVMVRSVQQARECVSLSEGSASLLASPESPIVVVDSRADGVLARAVAPGLSSVGVMLAYTALHHLLIGAVGRPLVVTSGNRGDEPMSIGNDEARVHLAGIADAFLFHDREIVSRSDDSVVRWTKRGTVMLRRARGYAPLPLELPIATERPVLAVGGHVKNTLTIGEGSRAWVSQHIGDLENLESTAAFDEVLTRFRRLLRVDPVAVVHDLHPDYRSTNIARAMGLEVCPPVQHHHAHIAAVQAEHGMTGAVLGLAFDGTGYGEDGRIWGAEFLRCDLATFTRLAHVRYAPMPGGDRAVRSPWRAALGYALLGEGPPCDLLGMIPGLRGVDPREIAVVRHQVERGINAPEASSMGRLFDAAAAVVGLRLESQFEGQAAMELESVAGEETGDRLSFPVVRGAGGLPVLDPVPLINALVARRLAGVSVGRLAASFHESVACASADLAVRLCREQGLDSVAMGGGCFQNVRLSSTIRRHLEQAGLRVLVPRRLGPNDGALSYGQAVVACARLAA